MAARPATGGLLGLGEAAAALGVHYMTAYRYVRTGVLEAHQAGGQWQVRPAAVDALVVAREQRATRAPAPRGGRRGPDSRSAGQRPAALADRLLAGDEAGAWRIVDDVVAGGWGHDELYLDLIAASLREVGDRWATGEATVADEHRATVVAMRVVGRLGPRAVRPGRPRGTVVVGAAPGDRHALPSALLADLLRARGLRVVDLGADTPPEHLAEAAAGEDRLLAIGICATAALDPTTEAQLADAVALVRHRAPVPVLLGGRAMDGLDAVGRFGADAQSADAAQALAWFTSVAPATRSPVGAVP